MAPRFQDRASAGRELAGKLSAHAHDPHLLILALPRGGVPVGYEIARELRAPLDVLIVRKLGAPGSEELAMGAIASGGLRVLNKEVVSRLGISPEAIEQAAQREERELRRREIIYRGERPMPRIEGATVILADDGLATGATMRAAVRVLRLERPANIIVAVPVGAPDSLEELRAETDEVAFVDAPEPFYAIGAWYSNFIQTTDEEVRGLLADGRRLSETATRPGG